MYSVFALQLHTISIDMAQRGKPSVAHEYDKNNQCIHCHMHESNVDALSHVCTAKRELEVDMAEAARQKMSLIDYQRG